MKQYRKWTCGHDGHFTTTNYINQSPFWRLANPEEIVKVQTLEQWAKQVNVGCITDADGYGLYAAFADGEYIVSDCIVVPSDITMGNVDLEFTHVVWKDNG